MAENDLIDVFDDCLNRLAAGETVEQCLRRYAAYDASLRPLLHTVRLAQRALPEAEETAAAQIRGRGALMDLMAEPAAKHQRTSSRWWVAVAALLVVCFGIGVLTVNSLPGDAFYGLKRRVEQGIVALSTDPEAAREATRQRRLDEIRLLLALGRVTPVEFSGRVETVADNALRVAGLDVTLNEDTERPPQLKAGDDVVVAAVTTVERTILARGVRILETGPEDVPEATAPVPTQTATPEPTATAVPPTNSPTPTATVRASATAIPSATESVATVAPLAATWTMPASLTPAPVSAETLIPPQRADCVTQRPAGWLTYSVRSGDSLSALASATGTSVSMIMQLNCLPSSGLIVPGQPLYLPSLPPTRAFSPAPPQPATGAGSDDSSGGRGSDGSGDDNSGDDTSGG